MTLSEFGIRWLSTIRRRDAPAVRAADTKSRTRSVSTSPRTSRAGTSQENTASTSTSVTAEELYRLARIRMANRNGIDSIMSTTRIISASARPPARPATAPQSMPMPVASSAVNRPISTAAWPPSMSRPSSSKPWLSVPSGCPAPGGKKVSRLFTSSWLV